MWVSVNITRHVECINIGTIDQLLTISCINKFSSHQYRTYSFTRIDICCFCAFFLFILVSWNFLHFLFMKSVQALKRQKIHIPSTSSFLNFLTHEILLDLRQLHTQQNLFLFCFLLSVACYFWSLISSLMPAPILTQANFSWDESSGTRFTFDVDNFWVWEHFCVLEFSNPWWESQTWLRRGKLLILTFHLFCMRIFQMQFFNDP